MVQSQCQVLQLCNSSDLQPLSSSSCLNTCRTVSDRVPISRVNVLGRRRA